jgi:hypothetical protein
VAVGRKSELPFPIDTFPLKMRSVAAGKVTLPGLKVPQLTNTFGAESWAAERLLPHPPLPWLTSV